MYPANLIIFKSILITIGRTHIKAVMTKNILLTGKPGVGKTTLIRKISEHFPDVRMGGFWTEEMRQGGRRVGFRVESFGGESGILSHVNFSGGPRVGKYGVDVAAFERIGVQALEAAAREADVILIDEIGKMELFSDRFQRAVLDALNSSKLLIATVTIRPQPFVDEIKVRPDVQVIEVTLANREGLIEKLASCFREVWR